MKKLTKGELAALELFVNERLAADAAKFGAVGDKAGLALLDRVRRVMHKLRDPRGFEAAEARGRWSHAAGMRPAPERET